MTDDGAIGIDLVTRNALCACMKDARPVIIPNRWGRASTPSVVGWDKGWVVGEDAVRLSLRGSCPIWWDIKRKVGSDFRALCGEKTYTAQDILVPLLCALREDAEVFLGRFVSSCVLAVPACFSLLQREAMTWAAKRAGLREVRVVSEPTAAALAFGRKGRFLVLDFGAGTVDISVVESEGGVWQVLESVGSDKVGGYDFDLALAEWLRERLRFNLLPPEDPRWRALVLEAESIKIALSSCQSYDWTPPALGASSSVTQIRRLDYGLGSIRIEREDLERLTRFSIRRLIHAVRKLWERHEPEHLLLVGGSSRIPLLREILEREIARPERLSLCAEESIATGAALYTQRREDRLLLDVLSGDIGFLRNGENQILIPAGTPVPFTARATFFPGRSERMTLPIFQTIGGLREERTLLSTLELDVTEDEEVELCCVLSASGLMTVSLRHGNMVIETSLFSLRYGDENNFSTLSRSMSTSTQRLHGLKLRLASLEMLFSPGQSERLQDLVRRIETIEDDEASVEILENVVKELELVLP
ncbi:MAG: Hsp70 family protein [Synergistaceae bacterium]|jgi:molecular chaperone DnaK (HSP70)|nr:Hsp70 family protein [Synergistaceae bacterium]